MINVGFNILLVLSVMVSVLCSVLWALLTDIARGNKNKEVRKGHVL